MHAFNANVVLIPKKLDTRSVRSTSDWILFYHIVMPLTRLSEQSEYEGYLAQSWKISSDFKEYIFTLRNRKFSDGSPIRPEDVVNTIKSQMKKGEAVHFDFRKIESISTEGHDSIKIRLKESSRQLIAQASQFEFGVIHSSEVGLPEGQRPHKITSGPYFIKKYQENVITLNRNKYFDNWLTGAPEEVNFYGEQQNDILKMITDGEMDYVEAFVDPVPHHVALKKGLIPFKPMLTQTMWVGMNGFSSKMKDIDARRYIQRLILESSLDLRDLAPGVEPSDQLFLPGNPGRFSTQELDEVWKKAKATSKPANFSNSLKLISAQGRPVGPRVVELLRKKGLKIDVSEFDMRNLAEVLKKRDFDLIVINNDFSTTETLENLLVATSGELPLMQIPPDSQVPKLLSDAQKTFEGEKRHTMIKGVARALFEEGIVIPFAYLNFIYYVNRLWDFSNWSIFTGDTPIWRLTKKKE